VEAEAEDLNRQLVALSREAGMAEVAASVLHNVGNVLNSVNVSIGLATEKVNHLKTTSLTRLASMLDEHKANLPAFFAEHPQGARLPQFLGQLAEHFAAEQLALLGELALLQSNLEHINEIVAMQQNYATAGGVIEVLPLAEVVEDALRMNAAAFQRHGSRVVREFDATLPALPLDRNKILLILVNLIRNAKYACDEGGGSDKCITLRTARVEGGGVMIAVSDSGVGISPENRSRIFEHGFTTRKNGHGFGLHSSALAAQEMGGALRVHSDGIGTGATFTLELPLKPNQP
jgi:signal transduction histidine kinase